jgi:protein SCO1
MMRRSPATPSSRSTCSRRVRRATSVTSSARRVFLDSATADGLPAPPALETGRRRYLGAVRRARLLLVALVLLAGCGSSTSSPPRPAFQQQAPRRFRGVVVSVRTAPPIALQDASGRRVTLASRRGGYTLVTFLYTHCPDVCPLIAANLNQALRLVGAQAQRVSVLAVSVDPKGDTPASVRAYARRLHLVPQFHYLIGSSVELRRVWTAYHVVAVARRADLVDHVAYTMLVDRRGKERLVYDSHVRASDVAHDLRVLMHTAAAS